MASGGTDQDTLWLKSKTKELHSKSAKKKFTTVEFFGGGGGLAEGISEACRRNGISHMTLFANEFDEDLLEIYKANHNPARFSDSDIYTYLDPVVPINFDKERMKREPNKYPKIRTGKLTSKERKFKEEFKELMKVDLLVGGPPCQGNSDLNNKSRRVDEKNLLYFTMYRFSKIFNPKMVIIENVRQVVHSSQEVVQRSEKQFKKLGYDVKMITVKASDFGVPQKRERHFFFASRIGEIDLSPLEKGIPEFVDKPRTVRWAFEGIDENLLDTDLFNKTADSNEENQSRMNWLIENDKFELPNHLRPKCHQDGHTYPAVYGRIYPDEPADTISTGFASNGQGRFTHPWARPGRTITAHEASSIQTFPENYKFPAKKLKTLRTAIGNAVPPLLAMHVAFVCIRLLFGIV